MLPSTYLSFPWTAVFETNSNQISYASFIEDETSNAYAKDAVVVEGSTVMSGESCALGRKEKKSITH